MLRHDRRHIVELLLHDRCGWIFSISHLHILVRREEITFESVSVNLSLPNDFAPVCSRWEVCVTTICDAPNPPRRIAFFQPEMIDHMYAPVFRSSTFFAHHVCRDQVGVVLF